MKMSLRNVRVIKWQHSIAKASKRDDGVRVARTIRVVAIDCKLKRDKRQRKGRKQQQQQKIHKENETLCYKTGEYK